MSPHAKKWVPVAAVVGLWAVLWAAPLAAQAPVVGPGGDPSVQDDTIYVLTVDPADHPEENSVVLLDDGIVVQEADGTGSTTYRTVAQVLNRDAVESWAEHTFGYDAGRARFRLNWARVVGPDGTVISAEPIHQQVMDVPVPEQSPVYTDAKRVRISLGGVEPGTIVDYSYTIETFAPVMPGEFYDTWRITTGGTVRRSRYVVDVPEGFDLHMDTSPDTEPTKVTHASGRVIREWTATDLERIEPELFADALEADFLKYVTLGGPNRWDDIGNWYADLARDRYDIGDDVRAAAAAELDSLGTPVEKLRGLYRWIAQDFRYISISLGQGGYQPRMPAEVLSTRSGDCKDKATLFVALARDLGFQAFPVLLSSSGGVEEDLPSVDQFDHEIATVNVDGEWVYLDLTAEVIPFGQISPSYQGEFGLVVMDDGSVRQITFPELGAEENLSLTVMDATLEDDGSLSGWYDESGSGALQYGLRTAFARDFSDKELERVADALAGRFIEGALGDSLSVFDGRDLNADPRVRVWIDAPRAAKRNGPSGYVLPIPFGSFGNPTILAQLEREKGKRRYPISIDAVMGPTTKTLRFNVLLPEGWTAELPPSVHAESRFGVYDSRYEQVGRQLKLERTLSGFEGTAPKEALDELVAWLRELSDDDVSFLVLKPAVVGS